MYRLKAIAIIVLGLCVIGVFPPPTRGQALPDIKVEKFELSNGLDVILYEDHSLPKVAINVLYDVGSKNEKPGRTGFAHLFEHMMFQGSAHREGEYFEPLNEIGAIANGGTTPDWTMYWEDVPSEYLELGLWLEADRMGFLLPAVTQEALDNQRDVVKNERRQSYENRPYAKAGLLLDEMLYPGGHPYSWPTIGSQEDLSAASLEDVKEFFRLYYAPNNASLVVAGDIDIDSARDLIEKYFGSIPPGPSIDKIAAWSPSIDKPKRAVMQDDVTLPRVYIAWHSPAHYAPGDADLDLLSSVLAGGKTSRLFKTLVYDRQMAQDVSVSQVSQVLGSYFQITVTAREGYSLDEIESVVHEELQRLRDGGITQSELDLVREEWLARFIRNLESVGGDFYSLAGQLNFYNTFLGDPNSFERDLGRYTEASVKSISSWARSVLDPNSSVTIQVLPRGAYSATESTLDRTLIPQAGESSEFVPPVVRAEKLDNGLEIYVIEDSSLPLVQANLVLKSGWLADDIDNPGSATLVAAMLDEGTENRNALEISDEIQRIAAQFSTSSSFDGSFLRLNVLKKNLGRGLDLMADVVLNPTFPEEELDRQRKNYIGQLQGGESSPDVRSRVALMNEIFGERHPYGKLMWQPLRFGATYFGFGTQESLGRIDRQALLNFYGDHYRPNNAAIVFVGDVTLAEAKAMAEERFGSWKRADVPKVDVPEASPVASTKVILIDKPDAPQSVIVAGNLGVSVHDPDFAKMRVVRHVLGGGFQRLDLNLREDKGYTYGAGLSMWNDGARGPMYVIAPVQTEVTDKALVEIIKEINGIDGERPITSDELESGKTNLVQIYPSLFESVASIAVQAEGLFLYDRPLVYWQDDIKEIKSLDLAEVNEVAQERFDADALAIVIVGDLSKIEEGVRALALGEVYTMDSTGALVSSGTN